MTLLQNLYISSITNTKKHVNQLPGMTLVIFEMQSPVSQRATGLEILLQKSSTFTWNPKVSKCRQWKVDKFKYESTRSGGNKEGKWQRVFKGISFSHLIRIFTIHHRWLVQGKCQRYMLNLYVWGESRLLGSFPALKWFMSRTEIDRLKRSLVQSAHHTSSCFHVIISFICRPSESTALRLGCSRSWKVMWTWVTLRLVRVLLVSPHLPSSVLKATAGKFPSLVQPVSLSLHHKLYFSILQSEKSPLQW